MAIALTYANKNKQINSQNIIFTDYLSYLELVVRLMLLSYRVSLIS